MPHLRIEVSAALSQTLNWKALANEIHHGIAQRGWASLNDLKTRVVVCAEDLAGDDLLAQQLVATLITTNPRPPDVLQAMQALVLAEMEKAVSALHPTQWVQCCVFLQATPKSDYMKWQWRAPVTPT
ncbi:MAG: hypothetical protein K2W33_15435 [Burkholderiales bacterium]|nr:hypothetical protein [Burkholderiales bacterium]